MWHDLDSEDNQCESSKRLMSKLFIVTLMEAWKDAAITWSEAITSGPFSQLSREKHATSPCMTRKLASSALTMGLLRNAALALPKSWAILFMILALLSASNPFLRTQDEHSSYSTPMSTDHIEFKPLSEWVWWCRLHWVIQDDWSDRVEVRLWTPTSQNSTSMINEFKIDPRYLGSVMSCFINLSHYWQDRELLLFPYSYLIQERCANWTKPCDWDLRPHKRGTNVQLRSILQCI